MDKELVMYSRSYGCPFITTAKQAKKRVLEWTGFLSVPTMVVANIGEDLPCTDFAPLPKGDSPRGIDRGPMLTEASYDEMENWLRKHGFID
jgi:hypothetical protein